MVAGLSLITAIVHWNTVWLDRAVRRSRAQGTTVPDDLLLAWPRSVGSISA
jgi:TnpA family transposase